MQGPRGVSPTAYQVLGVHPSAPPELISSAYWVVVGDLQKARSQGLQVDASLHSATRAYEAVSAPERRAQYDEAIGYTREPFITRPLPRYRAPLVLRIFRRGRVSTGLDYYEIIGLDEEAPADRAHEAHRIMRDHYLRVPGVRRRTRLIALLDEAYHVITDADQRASYDKRRRRGAQRQGHEEAPETRAVEVPEAFPAPVPKARTSEAPEVIPIASVPVASPETTTDSRTPSVTDSSTKRGSSARVPPEAEPAGAGVPPIGRQVLPGLLRAAAAAIAAAAQVVGICARELSRASRAAWERLARARTRPVRHRPAVGQSADPRTPPPVKAKPTSRRPNEEEEAFLDRLASSVEQVHTPPPEDQSSDS